MKYRSLTKFTSATIVTIVALLIGACSGSGSGPNPFDEEALDNGGGTTGQLTLEITTPAASGVVETPDESILLAGTAGSASGVASVSWQSDQGGQGEASGSESWETGLIPLEIGDNTITVTATDNAGATASRTIVIKRESQGTGSVTLSWEPPTTRADGTPLTDLAGYIIQYGRMSGTYDFEIKIENPGVVTYVVENLAPGTWYFVITAYDSEGLTSAPSNEISVTIP